MSTAMIKRIDIKNFRSISNIKANLTPFTILCGRNDVGKSNILRSLNLFFNGFTNNGVEFNFENDFNFNAEIPSRKAKEIVISIDIELPESYNKLNGDFIRWTKIWREDGLHGGEDNICGYRIVKTKRNTTKENKVEISNSSNARKLLKRIEYEYVPAIKSASYFDDLRGRIYKTISEVATNQLEIQVLNLKNL